MRDAFIITIILIALFLVAGYMYNVMAPHFAKLGIISSDFGPEAKDGGLFVSKDFGRSWNQIVDKEEDISKSSVFGLEFDKRNSDVITIATSRGLFRSENMGNSWSSFLGEALSANEGVGSFAIDPKNRERMYVAPYSTDRGGRILKSKGEGFYEVYSTASKEDRVLGIWIDAFDTSTIYAGTQSGLFLASYDFGESWVVKKEFNEPVRSLYMLTNDTRIMYVTTNKKIYKTLNQGQSWQDISLSLRNRYGDTFKVNSIAIYPHNESRIYAATTHGLLRSNDAGASFSRIELLAAGSEPRVSSVGLDPSGKDVIYIGVGSQIHKSGDGGISWQIKKLNTSREINVIKVKLDDPSVIFVGIK